jgi:hypothetical protein
VTVGAPTVLTLAITPSDDLPATVNRIDPSGRHAAAVEVFRSGTTTVLAADPDRLAAVANWSATGVDNPRRLLSALHPSAPDPIVLDGDRVRVTLDVNRFGVLPAELTLDAVSHGGSSPTPVDLGLVKRRGTFTGAGELTACPCVVRDLQLTPNGPPVQVTGALTLRTVEVQRGSGPWQPVPGATDATRWRDPTDQQVGIDSSGGGALSWSFFSTPGTPPTLITHSRPEPLPAVVASALQPGNSTVEGNGLNGATLPVSVNARVPNLPSAPADGIIVDLTFAERAAYGDLGPSDAQVWVRGDVGPVRRGLAAAHIPIVSQQTSSSLNAQLSRQGPGLASELFLADAAAAAVLAALAAVLSLSAAARRRRYEYAALAAAGASRRTLYAALAIEQLVVIGFGAVTGVGAGLLATALAGRSVPEFVHAPADALLRHQPSVLVLAIALGGGLLLLLTSAALAAGALLRSVNPDQLRESPI